MSRGFVWGVAAGFVAAGLLGVGGRLATSGVAQQPAPLEKAVPGGVLAPQPLGVTAEREPPPPREPTLPELLAKLDALKAQQAGLERQYRDAAEQVRKKYEAEQAALDQVKAELERRGILQPSRAAPPPPVPAPSEAIPGPAVRVPADSKPSDKPAPPPAGPSGNVPPPANQ